MLHQQIIFVKEYTKGKGFEPFTNEQGDQVSFRRVEIQTNHYHSSYDHLASQAGILTLSIINCIAPCETKAYRAKSGFAEEFVYSFDINTESSELTLNQKFLINAICCGDLKGKTAENTMYWLYVKLFVLNENSDFRKYLPDVYEWFKKNERFFEDFSK